MGMQVIGRETFKQGDAMITLTKNGIYFSRTAVKYFKLQPGQYLFFINDDNDWYFYKTLDTDAFNLVRKDGGKSGLEIMSRPLARMLIRSMKVKLRQRLVLTDTKRKHGNETLIKIGE